MSNRLLTGLLGLLLVLFASTAKTMAVETLSTLDLVTDDAAFCLEIPSLDETWGRLESGPMMNRLQSFPPYQRFLVSHGFQQWQAVEEHVTKQTGSKLSAQLLDLFGKSLVLAIYVPPTGNPRGILIGEAIDAAAIQMAIATWNKLEPTEVISTKSHHGRRYSQRKKHATAAESLFIATSDRWFAVSDHETLIQDVIDRFASLTSDTPRSSVNDTLRQSPLFAQNRQRLKADSVAYVHVNARPWDHGLEESSRGTNDPIDMAAIWKHVTVVSACLRIDRGIVCDAVVELDTARLPHGWSQFVATASSKPSWIRRVPAEALLAIEGRAELAPLIRHMLNQVPSNDRAELAKNRRIAQSIFGGQDVLDSILPTLAREFGGFVTTRTDDRTNKVTLDGALGFTLDSLGDAGMLLDLDHGLDSGLSLLAAYLSAEGKNVVTIRREQNESTRLRSMSETAPFPVGYGFKGTSLVVAGSRGRLRQTLDSLDEASSHPRLAEHSSRFFSGTNQLIWFDVARTREVLEQNGPDLDQLFAHGSADETSNLVKRFEQFRQHLGLVDALFVAGHIASDHVRVVFGGGLDSNGSKQRE